MQTSQLPDNNGYIDIKISDVEVVNTTNTVIHIVNVDEILKTLSMLEENVKTVDLSNRQILLQKVQDIHEKIMTIKPKQHREKRGLINLIGTAQKWLYGTMDDDDRMEIMEHISVNEENNRNIIKTVNKQIIINGSFNKSIISLKNSIEQDRINIKSALEQVRKNNNEIVKRYLYLDQLSKLNFLEDKIEKLQDDIASAKNNLIHPSIFTKTEIENFDIDFYKLKLLKIGVMTFRDNSLIIAIQIPDQIITAQLRLLTAVPNGNCMEIDESDEKVIEINNVVLHYKENIILKHLQRSSHCSIKNNCRYVFNNRTEIIEIDEETILLKNARKINLKQTCDNRNLSLFGNYLINFYNCSITITNQTFKNKKHIIHDKFYFPPPQIINVTKTNLEFDAIILEHTKNIKEINELKVHSKITYGLSLTLIIIAIFAFILFYIVIKKNKVARNKTQVITVPNVPKDIEDIINKYQ